jgi:beta-lactamase class A
MDSADLVEYSPVTELHVEGGLPVSKVIEAALTYSDNTAGNLLMGLVDGPDGLEERLRAVGTTPPRSTAPSRS